MASAGSGLWLGNHERRLVDALGRDACRYSGGQACDLGLVLLFTNRSGSNHLADLLASTEAIPRPMERFNAPGILRFCERGGHTALNPYFGEQLWSAQGGVFTTKASVDQAMMLRRFGFLDAFGRTAWVAIRRRDLVEQAVSFYIADATKRWTSLASEAAAPAYDFGSILRRFRGFTRSAGEQQSFFSVFKIDPVIIDYEDLVTEPQQHVDRVGRLLGRELGAIDPSRLRLQKQGNDLNAEFAQRFRSDLIRLNC